MSKKKRNIIYIYKQNQVEEASVMSPFCPGFLPH